MTQDSLTFLGTGTSYGIPQIACGCSVCNSDDPRNTRSRCSAVLTAQGQNLLIDVTPDFRSQALREQLVHVDGVFITHVHADHVFGLDDLRPLSLNRDVPTPVFADAESCAQLRTIFSYIFCTEERRPGIPWLVLREIKAGQSFQLGGASFMPFSVEHGRWPCFGLRYKDFAYITDAKRIPRRSQAVLSGLKKLCLDLLRDEPHPTHMSRAESLAAVQELGGPETWFIHMGHEVDHTPFEGALPENCYLAYDGLKIEVNP